MSSKRVEKAADKWVAALLGAEERRVVSAETRSVVRSLAVAAFALYAEAWGPGWNIARWEYPFTTIAERDYFPGEQPWIVLFRRAVELAGPKRPKVATPNVMGYCRNCGQPTKVVPGGQGPHAVHLDGHTVCAEVSQ